MRAGEVYEHPFERLVVRVGTAESGGRELVADLCVRGDAPGVPRHRHPTVEETLTVIRGKVGAWTQDKGERILGPGDTVCVPPNTTHAWRPVGDEEVRMLVTARPGARFEEMWRQFMGLSQDGKMGPKGPGFLQIMMMAQEFPDVMAVAGPPLFLQRAVAALVTPIGRLRGYRGRYEEYLTRGPSMIVEPEPLPVSHSMPLITARRSGE
jgi:mannose-6-phosphate isomerase-like protein (cupin superfamily)